MQTCLEPIVNLLSLTYGDGGSCSDEWLLWLWCGCGNVVVLAFKLLMFMFKQCHVIKCDSKKRKNSTISLHIIQKNSILGNVLKI